MARKEGRLQANTQRTEAVGATIHEDSILPHDMNELRRLSLSLDFLKVFPVFPRPSGVRIESPTFQETTQS